MAITREDVLHVAKLARLEIPEDQIERVQAELGAILDAVGKVSELDLEGVEPTSHPLDMVNVWAAGPEFLSVNDICWPSFAAILSGE